MPEFPVDLPADAKQAIVELGAVALQPYGAEQRHRSLRVLTSKDEVLWLKIDVADDLATVKREVAVLGALRDVPSVPRHVSSGYDGSWLLTTSVDGVQLAELAPAAQRQALPAVAAWLVAFRDRAASLPGFEVPDWDLFGRSCNLAAILEPALAWWIEDVKPPLETDILLETIRSHPPARGPVHGSFDPQNILVGDDGTVGAVDFEAARPGLTSYDTAALLARLSAQDPHLANEWWQMTVGPGNPSEAAYVLGHLLLRTWYRHCAGVLVPEALESLVSFLPTATNSLSYRN